MREIIVSEAVWQQIAERGRFGETEEDVLRRVFSLAPAERGASNSSESTTVPTNGRGASSQTRRPRKKRAIRRMSPYIERNQLHVEIESGPQRSWPLPPRSDKLQLRKVRDEAVEFVKQHGATIGQINAVKKALTENGYHLTK